jgi:O-antigen ligase
VLLSVAAAGRPTLIALGPAVVLAALAWRWPDSIAGLLTCAALAIRPSLDTFSERRLGLGPLTLQPAAVFGAVVLLVGLVLALRRMHEGRRIWPDREVRAAHGWLAAAIAILVLSGVRLFDGLGLAEGTREATRVASIVMVFLLVWWWLEGRPARRATAWLFLVVGLIPPILVALWQRATDHGFWEPGSGLRIQGTFSHPNSFAQYLVPFVFLAIAGIPAARLRDKIWRLGAALGLVVLIMLTYSRTAILILATGLAALVVMHLAWRVRRSLAPIVAVLVFAAAGWLVVGEQVRERFASVSLRRAVEEARVGRSENSFGWRLLNWRGLVLRGLEHPIAGHGAGMTTRLNPLVSTENGVPFNAHNDFVRFFFEGGVLGLACYILYGLLLCRWAVRRARDSEPEAAAIAATLLSMFFLTGGMTELSLHTANQYVLYALLALANAAPPPRSARPTPPTAAAPGWRPPATVR